MSVNKYICNQLVAVEIIQENVDKLQRLIHKVRWYNIEFSVNHTKIVWPSKSFIDTSETNNYRAFRRVNHFNYLVKSYKFFKEINIYNVPVITK